MKNIGSGNIPSPVWTDTSLDASHARNNPCLCELCEEMKQQHCKIHPDYTAYHAVVVCRAVVCNCKCHRMNKFYEQMKRQKLKAFAANA